MRGADVEGSGDRYVIHWVPRKQRVRSFMLS